MKLFIAGQKYFGMSVYQLIRGLGHEIVGVSSPAWRDEKRTFAYGDKQDKSDQLRGEAELRGTPWMEAGSLNADTLPEGTDLIIAAHSHDIIGRLTRARCTYGAIGYHPSLLPLHRGRDAIRWSLRLHERITGGTVFWLNDTVDGGPVAAQDWIFIPPKTSADELWRTELQPLGLRLIKGVVHDIAKGVIVQIPQDPTLATWEPGLNPPRLYRPDLLMLTDGRKPLPGLQVVRSRAAERFAKGEE